ncbi:MAG: hypothetical protein A2X61_15740 [Ignavibacteria bacterium GWB2_35_12]|nr:MAG: hypothetical protein A2X63_10700 [Ignavibacteria bacterium GWA2_35_8]OGU40827.1 MAG: hypothetical protein A2X61_15740 [Ignavibacteria bacterium GWB2_35_12]OGU87119.1 MAG: hypothetical protein A2220_08115 [Ignavibacteria bacterium RIFOXYA2_FULL_35_10]OGV24654.1 MAG: hypothetical protein A2475_14515 [Ignavibacteria bacterium RIFOXYC2_FULL_35_21]
MMRWLFAILMAILLLSFNSYSQWEKANGGKELPDSTAISAIMTNGNTVIAATAKGVYVSTNNGENWVLKNNGLSDPTQITALGLKGNLIFAGTYEIGIYVSSDNGNIWIKKDNGMSGEGINCFFVNNNNIYAGTSSGIYMSSDNGNNWIPKNQGITEYEYTGINSLAIKDSTIFAGTSDGVYASTNNGDNWSRKNFQVNVSSIVVNKNNIYISGDGYNTGIHVSTDNGSTWVAKNTGMDISESTKFYLLSYGDSVYTGASRQGVFLTNDNGNNWIQYSDGLSPYVQGFELMLATNEKYLFVGSTGATGYCTLWRRLHNEPEISVEEDYTMPGILQAYPNPSSDYIFIKCDGDVSLNQSIKIYDILGNTVWQGIMEGEPIRIDISSFPTGVYYVNVNGSTKMFVRN